MAHETEYRRGLGKTRKGLFGRLKQMFRPGASVDGELADQLEEVLIEADVGVQTAIDIVDKIRDGHDVGSADDLMGLVGRELRAQLEAVAREHPVADPPPPRVTFLVGVNGTGKTTTVAKLAARSRAEGRSVLLCAADTFRAAAIEQLELWGSRLGVDVIRHRDGSDAAAVVFDALKAARARGVDQVLVDTAGRLHTHKNLMRELEKLVRVAGREIDGAPHEVLLVLDATTGQNGIQQARQFAESIPVTGLVLTKLDGTARGGIAITIVRELGLPLRYVGLGEGAEDLVPFDAQAYLDGIFAVEA